MANSDPKVALQIELETLYSKNQLIPRIRSEYVNCKEFDFASYMQSHNIPTEFGFDLLVQMALHKRTTINVLVGILRKHFDVFEKASQMAADMLLECIRVGLVEYSIPFKQFIVMFDITRDVQDDLDKYQYPLPMVVEPRPVRTNKEEAYYLTNGSIILRQNHHDDDVCLDHINRMNKIKFTIDEKTSFLVRNEWKNLDKPKAGETYEEFKTRLRAFEKYDRTSKDVITKILSLGNEFYLTHKYDKRGRIYCQGYHINYQGTTWNKAVVQLADKEIVP